MIEKVITKDCSLTDIPNEVGTWGIALPYCTKLNKDDIVVFADTHSTKIGRDFKLHRKLSEYIQKWGIHTYYLGTYQNRIGVTIRMFATPVRESLKGQPDLTTIVTAMENLAVLCEKYLVDLCLLPMPVPEEFIEYFINCAKPCMELLLGDKFVMIHRG